MSIMHALASVWVMAAAGDIHQPGDHSRTTKVNGTDRSYIVHIPTSYMRGNSTPWCSASTVPAPPAR